jgi:fatty acid CoA ligase FadD21
MPPSSILSMLRDRAGLQPDDTAFTYTDYGQDWAGVAESLTWSQAYRRTVNVALEVGRHGPVVDRAVILAPQGLEYIAAFPATTPTTTSGKIRRAACVDRYRQEQFARLDA